MDMKITEIQYASSLVIAPVVDWQGTEASEMIADYSGWLASSIVPGRTEAIQVRLTRCGAVLVFCSFASLLIGCKFWKLKSSAEVTERVPTDMLSSLVRRGGYNSKLEHDNIFSGDQCPIREVHYDWDCPE